MPPKTSSRKRVLAEVDPNTVATVAAGPASKSAATTKSKAAKSKTAAAKTQPTLGAQLRFAILEATPPRLQSSTRIARGPDNEHFLPRIIPEQWAQAVEDNGGLLHRWTRIDATPGRELTFANAEWLRKNWVWIFAAFNSYNVPATQEILDLIPKPPGATGPSDEGDNNENEAMQDDDWVCVSRPAWDEIDEKGELSDDEEDSHDGDTDDDEDKTDKDEDKTDKEEDKKVEDEDKKDEDEKKTGRVHMQLASLHPNHVWVFTLLGYERFEWWLQQHMQRDQNNFDMYIYNDFSYYGCIEVMENSFIAFSKVYNKKSPQPLAVWHELEGVALYLNSGFADFFMCDDAERCSRLVELGGAMILGTVDMLVKAGMFNADSPIRNLGLVLALFLRWVDSVVQVSDYFQDEARWAAVLVALAEEHGVTIDGPFILTEALERLPDLEDVPRGVQTKWKRIKWRGQIAMYQRDYGLGGKEFDIFAMPKAEKERYKLGGESMDSLLSSDF